nr:hypothetical protein [Tanacetum cinerariifolium]
MFWYTARDDAMFNTIKVIFRHQDTHIHGAILLDVLSNQEILDSKAYKECYAVTSGVVPPKAKTKYKKKTDEPVTSAKSKTAFASKGTKLKSKAKVTKPDMKKQLTKKTKAKGLAVLSEVALSKAEQIKMDTKRSKKDFYISHASGSDDGVDTQSKVHDEQEQKNSSTDERTDEDDNDDDGDNDDEVKSDDHDDDSDAERTGSDGDEILDLNLTNVDQTEHEEEDVNEGVYTPSDDEFTDKEKLDDEETMDDEEDDETEYEEDVDEGVRTHSDDELTDEEKIDDEETMDDEEDDEVLKELYEDVNVKLENNDDKMTDANQEGSEQQNISQESGFEQEEDVHVTLTMVFDAQKANEPVQSSSVSSDLTSKFLNLENRSLADNEFASLMETSAPHATAILEITFSFTTTTPPPPLLFNPLLQQLTPTITTPTFITITSINPTMPLPEILNFAYVFKFNQRVFALESEMCELK